MKVLVLGNGSIGERHIKNLKELGHEVRSFDPICDHHCHREHRIRRADAVVIASPTNQHYQDIVDCQRAGKLIFCEKPIVSNLADYHATGPELIMMVGYNLRFHSCVKRARHILGQGQIGKPLWANFTCAQYSDKPSYFRDGVILNWSHEIDLAVHLLGSANVNSCSSNALETIADLTLVHQHHFCQTNIHLDYVTKPERRGFTIVGDKGILEVDLVKRHLFVTDSDDDLIESFHGRDSFDGNYLDEMRKFIERCQGEITIGCTAKEAFGVMDLCLRAKELARDISNSAGPNGVDQVTWQGDDAVRRPTGTPMDYQCFTSDQTD